MLLWTHRCTRFLALDRRGECRGGDRERRTLLEFRQAAVFGLIVLVTTIDLEPAREAQHAARSTQPEAASFDIDGGLVELGGRRLRRDGALPDEVVELELFLGQERT